MSNLLLIDCVDTLDDRRELLTLLGHLSPMQRFRFLGWACSLAEGNMKPQASWLRMKDRIREAIRGCNAQDAALTRDIYADLIMLSLQYKVNLADVAVGLESFVRHPSRLPLAGAVSSRH